MNKPIGIRHLADWLGIPRHTFSAVFGVVIAGGEHYRQVFQYFCLGIGLDAERQARLDAGLGEFVNSHGFYPDVRPCLHALKDAGYIAGIAHNQSTGAVRNREACSLAQSRCRPTSGTNLAEARRSPCLSGLARIPTPNSAMSPTTSPSPAN